VCEHIYSDQDSGATEEDGETKFMYSILGRGRNNFIGAWDIPDVEFDMPVPLTPWLNQRVYVPYCSTPPANLAKLISSGRWRSTCTKADEKALTGLIGGMWTIPPDWRLDFEFQYYMLRQREQDFEILESVKLTQRQLLDLSELGGLFHITDIDLKGRYHTYHMENQLLAAQVEEFYNEFPGTVFRATDNGFPGPRIGGPGGDYVLRWNRLV
jgi:hypothetical protein